MVKCIFIPALRAMNPSFVYVSCAGSRRIDAFSLNTENGDLESIQQLTTQHAPLPMKLGANRSMLYVGTRGENTIQSYAIDPANGKLTLSGESPLPGAPAYVSCDHARRVAFAASYADHKLSVHPLTTQDAASVASQCIEGLPRAHAAVVDATNRWLLVPTLGADAICIYGLDPESAALTPAKPPAHAVRSGSGPRHLVFAPDNRFVYCLNELDGSIDVFTFDAEQGRLAWRQSISLLPHGFSGQPWAAEIRLTPDGRFLYTTERRSSTLAVFAVDNSVGDLALFGHYPTETQPRGMAIAPCGGWLAVAGQLSAHITLYALSPETGLPAPHSRFPTGDDPICIEIR